MKISNSVIQQLIDSKTDIINNLTKELDELLDVKQKLVEGQIHTAVLISMMLGDKIDLIDTGKVLNAIEDSFIQIKTLYSTSTGIPKTEIVFCLEPYDTSIFLSVNNNLPKFIECFNKAYPK